MQTNYSRWISRIIIPILVGCVLIVAGSGCNTTHGFGKDVSKTGEWIQRGTR